MPLHLPHFGLNRHHSEPGSNNAQSETDAYISSDSNSPRVTIQQPERSMTIQSVSSSSSSSSQPPSILRKEETRSNFTSGSSAGSSRFSKRMSGLSINRQDTISSILSSDDERDGNSTPATSVSSFGNQCPLPSQTCPFFAMTLSSTSTLSFIALPPNLRPVVLDAINRAWKKGINKAGEVSYQPELMKQHKDKGAEGGVWEVTMRGAAWMPDSAEQVSSKRILLYLFTEFARIGYSLTSSFRTSAKDSGKDTLMFVRGEPDPDPIFFAIAFYSSDRIWIVDAEADVGQAIEKGITTSWVDGIRDVRTRERHCREIRLRGSPWVAHTTSTLISARCLHIVIMAIVTRCHRGYEFVASVDMADKEEAELPCTFYRAEREGSGIKQEW